jgi:hypothetical protein
MELVTQRWFRETVSPHDSAGDSAASTSIDARIIVLVNPTGTPTGTPILSAPPLGLRGFSLVGVCFLDLNIFKPQRRHGPPEAARLTRLVCY